MRLSGMEGIKPFLVHPNKTQDPAGHEESKSGTWKDNTVI